MLPLYSMSIPLTSFSSRSTSAKASFSAVLQGLTFVYFSDQL